MRGMRRRRLTLLDVEKHMEFAMLIRIRKARDDKSGRALAFIVSRF
ncbi:protein of unknown function [Vibrio tapetis subsp. tapetis]|uniref:Uncharacterized protein n=1 Tax=Vibrio tapetis subsp. tapetis TaxID=1671868 RepID=A0A2N8ZFN8_9VIBR|nr:protein of unknown function [Vibrio tapetis subsp. tapetis]